MSVTRKSFTIKLNNNQIDLSEFTSQLLNVERAVYGVPLKKFARAVANDKNSSRTFMFNMSKGAQKVWRALDSGRKRVAVVTTADRNGYVQVRPGAGVLTGHDGVLPDVLYPKVDKARKSEHTMLCDGAHDATYGLLKGVVAYMMNFESMNVVNTCNIVVGDENDVKGVCEMLRSFLKSYERLEDMPEEVRRKFQIYDLGSTGPIQRQELKKLIGHIDTSITKRFVVGTLDAMLIRYDMDPKSKKLTGYQHMINKFPAKNVVDASKDLFVIYGNAAEFYNNESGFGPELKILHTFLNSATIVYLLQRAHCTPFYNPAADPTEIQEYTTMCKKILETIWSTARAIKEIPYIHWECLSGNALWCPDMKSSEIDYLTSGLSTMLSNRKKIAHQYFTYSKEHAMYGAASKDDDIVSKFRSVLDAGIFHELFDVSKKVTEGNGATIDVDTKLSGLDKFETSIEGPLSWTLERHSTFGSNPLPVSVVKIKMQGQDSEANFDTHRMTGTDLKGSGASEIAKEGLPQSAIGIYIEEGKMNTGTGGGDYINDSRYYKDATQNFDLFAPYLSNATDNAWEYQVITPNTEMRAYLSARTPVVKYNAHVDAYSGFDQRSFHAALSAQEIGANTFTPFNATALSVHGQNFIPVSGAWTTDLMNASNGHNRLQFGSGSRSEIETLIEFHNNHYGDKSKNKLIETNSVRQALFTLRNDKSGPFPVIAPFAEVTALNPKSKHEQRNGGAVGSLQQFVNDCIQTNCGNLAGTSFESFIKVVGGVESRTTFTADVVAIVLMSLDSNLKTVEDARSFALTLQKLRARNKAHIPRAPFSVSLFLHTFLERFLKNLADGAIDLLRNVEDQETRLLEDTSPIQYYWFKSVRYEEDDSLLQTAVYYICHGNDRSFESLDDKTAKLATCIVDIILHATPLESLGYVFDISHELDNGRFRDNVMLTSMLFGDNTDEIEQNRYSALAFWKGKTVPTTGGGTGATGEEGKAEEEKKEEVLELPAVVPYSVFLDNCRQLRDDWKDILIRSEHTDEGAEILEIQKIIFKQ